MSISEFRPVRPRKASAGTRRHHRKALPFRLGLLVPGADQVRVSPVYWAGQPTEGVWRVFVTDARGRALHPWGTTSPRIVSLLQGAWPGADWTVQQTWIASRNELVTDPPAVRREAS